MTISKMMMTHSIWQQILMHISLKNLHQHIFQQIISRSVSDKSYKCYHQGTREVHQRPQVGREILDLKQQLTQANSPWEQRLLRVIQLYNIERAHQRASKVQNNMDLTRESTDQCQTQRQYPKDQDQTCKSICWMLHNLVM